MGTIKVLLVEDNDGDAVYLERKLRTTEAPFEVRRVSWLSSALQAVESLDVDIVLLDLTLPDSQGIDTVMEVEKAAPDLPIVVMTGHDDIQTALNAVRVGAQDYLIKGESNAKMLERTMLLALERKRVDEVGKEFLRVSIGNLEEVHAGEPSLNLAKTHVAHVMAALEDVLTYLRKNAPTHLEAVQAILDKHSLPIALREMRDLITPDGPAAKRKRSISSTALNVVGTVMDRRSSDSSVPPMTDAPTARGALLEIIQRRERLCDG